MLQKTVPKINKPWEVQTVVFVIKIGIAFLLCLQLIISMSKYIPSPRMFTRKGFNCAYRSAKAFSTW